MDIFEQWKREEDIKADAERIFLSMLRDEHEITDVFLSGGLAPVWLFRLLELTESFETDEKFYEVAKPLGTGDAFKALFAAKELRQSLVKVLAERALTLAERT